MARSDGDGRVRTARLTRRGIHERVLLDQGSDELARSFLEPLSVSNRDRLVAAMAEVERLLTAGLVEIDDADPAGPDGRHCLESYFAELGPPVRGRLRGGPQPRRRRRRPATRRRTSSSSRAFGRAGRLRRPEAQAGRPGGAAPHVGVATTSAGSASGSGYSPSSSARAAARGAGAVRLETNRTLTEAIGLYRASGYREIPAFNDEVYAHHWFEKTLVQASER